MQIAVDARFCDECGRPFAPTRPDQRFCPVGLCRQNYHNRAIKGGRKLYEAMVAWRVEYRKGAWKALCAVADDLAREEREIRRKRDERIARHRSPPDPLRGPETRERAPEAAAIE